MVEFGFRGAEMLIVKGRAAAVRPGPWPAFSAPWVQGHHLHRPGRQAGTRRPSQKAAALTPRRSLAARQWGWDSLRPRPGIDGRGGSKEVAKTVRRFPVDRCEASSEFWFGGDNVSAPVDLSNS